MPIETIAEYIDQYEGTVRERLHTVIDLVRKAVPPKAEESIKWRMPAFMLGKEPLFFVTAAKQHLSFYPTDATIAAFSEQLKPYETSEHAVKFRHRNELPIELIEAMIKWRIHSLSS